MTTIRNYQPSDFPQVKEVLESGDHYWEDVDNEESLERKIQRDPESILVAVKDDKIVGTQFIVDDFMPLLFRLVVHPNYRGEGIGTLLREKGEEVLQKRGHNHVSILVASERVELQKHFVERGYERGNTYTWMDKKLQ